MRRNSKHGVFLPTGSKIYYCCVEIRKKKYRKSTGLTDLKAAKAWAKAWKQELIRTLDAGPVNRMRFIDAVDGFLAYKRARGEPQPYRDTDLDFLTDEIGDDTDIATIDNFTIAALVEKRGSRSRWDRSELGLVKPATITQTVIRPMSAIMHWARRHGKIPICDMPDWGEFLVEGEPRKRELSFREELDLLPACGDFALPLEYILLSGVRLRNALITWQDVHREEGVIRVIAKGRKLHEIVITPEIEALLDRAELTSDGEHVFTYVKETKAGKQRLPITAANLAYRFKVAAKACGIRNIVIHDLRRTAGARMYRAIDDLNRVSKFLGHSKIDITAKHYAHIITQDRRIAMSKAELYRQEGLAKARMSRLAA